MSERLRSDLNFIRSFACTLQLNMACCSSSRTSHTTHNLSSLGVNGFVYLPFSIFKLWLDNLHLVIFILLFWGWGGGGISIVLTTIERSLRSVFVETYNKKCYFWNPYFPNKHNPFPKSSETLPYDQKYRCPRF